MSRDWARGWFGGLPTPLLVLSARGKLSTLLFCSGQKISTTFFALGSSEVAIGILSLFCIFCPEFAQLCVHTVLFFVLFCFCFHSGGRVFVFSYRGDKFIHVQALQHCSKGSKVPQPVSECIIYLFALLSLCQVYVT